MKTILISLSVLLITSCAAQDRAEDQLQKLEWLCETWERMNTKSGQQTFEIWEKEEDRLTGVGYTLQGSDTVFVERLSITVIDGELYYGSEVAHNPEAVYFKMKITGSESFESSNPKHDFPKKITYKLDNDLLTATISGDGKAIPFQFKKVNSK